MALERGTISENLDINNEIVKNYLGTSYILSNKADFEPRKNIRLYI